MHKSDGVLSFCRASLRMAALLYAEFAVDDAVSVDAATLANDRLEEAAEAYGVARAACREVHVTEIAAVVARVAEIDKKKKKNKPAAVEGEKKKRGRLARGESDEVFAQGSLVPSVLTVEQIRAEQASEDDAEFERSPVYGGVLISDSALS